ncbi:MAG: hypothetical protein AB1420_07535 [Bacillota bacterium]
MNGIPVVKSKLVMPQLPHSFVMSNRIKRIAKAIHSKDVVMTTAPAGYGKTSLIIAALNMYGQNYRICWYRLDQEDRDLAVFFTHFIEALFPTEENEWHECRANLANYCDIYSQYQSLIAIICRELWVYHNHHKKIKTFIVLDDFQQVKDSQNILGPIQYLINNLPKNCSIIVNSRSESGILTGKMRLEKDVLEINSNDLCFSEEDLSILLKNYGINTDNKMIQKIMFITEGWAAGIIMICQILSRGDLQGSSIQGIGGILEKPGEKAMLFKYIAIEVLKTVDPGLMLFLIKAAILRDFTAVEVSSIFDIKDVHVLLSQCEKQGLFVQKIPGEITTYRFHGLFREVLQQLQAEYFSEEEIRCYHQQAAAYYIAS